MNRQGPIAIASVTVGDSPFDLGVSQIVLKVEVASAGLLSLVVEEDVNAAVVRLRCSLVVAQSDCRSRRDAA